jgi:hypothetical protein
MYSDNKSLQVLEVQPKNEEKTQITRHESKAMFYFGEISIHFLCDPTVVRLPWPERSAVHLLWTEVVS